MSHAKSAEALPTGLSTKTKYLIAYNATSAWLWSLVLVRVILTLTVSRSAANVYANSGTFVKQVQTLALLEVLHSLVGLVRAPVQTTAMQVASRLLLVWGVVGLFPMVVESLPLDRGRRAFGMPVNNSTQVAYSSMLIAWSITEVVRYGYFVFFLTWGTQGVPRWLSWLRYNTFYVLYPIGISSECWLIYKALPFAKKWDLRYEYFLMISLLIYIPGSYILFTHMMTQRKRVMRGKETRRGN